MRAYESVRVCVCERERKRDDNEEKKATANTYIYIKRYYDEQLNFIINDILLDRLIACKGEKVITACKSGRESCSFFLFFDFRYTREAKFICHSILKLFEAIITITITINYYYYYYYYYLCT